MIKVSVIINNYNYARFLSRCIDSALAQTYRNCEVIVVDDGSTDDSAAVIRNYGDRLIPVLKPNGGQASAYRVGFEQATGDLVQFLDADDYLAEDCIARVVAAWRKGVVKVQFQLAIVDEDGDPVNARTPSGRMTDRKALQMVRLFGTYCSPPASGNVFSRAFLQQILPLPNEMELKFNADAPVILSAPYFGEIVSIGASIGFYRRHAAAHTSGTLEKFDEVEALRRLEGEGIRDKLCGRSLSLLLFRHSKDAPVARFREPSRAKRELCLLRLGEAKRGQFINRAQAAWVGIRGSLQWDGYSIPQRVSACVWFLCVGFLPYQMAEGFIRIALNMGSRPNWMSRFLGCRR